MSAVCSKHDHRNLGIIILFWVGFFTIQLIAVELQRDEAAAASAILFKRSKATADIQRAIEKPDEAGDPEAVVNAKVDEETISAEKQNEIAQNTIVKPKEVLTWRHVNYDIPVKCVHFTLAQAPQ